VIVFGQIAQRLLTQAQHDQVDTSAVIRRPGVRTAADATVGHPGGRPSLTPKAVQDQLTLLAESTA
jgi:hypothetical protein